MPEPIRVDVYSRSDCHLCDEAKAVIDRVRRRHHFELNIINIDGYPELEDAYGTDVPVVFVNGNKAFKYRVDEAELERKIRRLWKT